MLDPLKTPMELSFSRLIRFAAMHPCTDRRMWREAEEALADDSDKTSAIEDLELRKRKCGCTPCAAKRIKKKGLH